MWLLTLFCRLLSGITGFLVGIGEALSPRSRRWAVLLVRALLIGGFFALSAGPVFPSRELDDATITRFSASFRLDADGGLQATERLRVWLPAGKHGIYRDFDTSDPRRRGVEHPVEIVDVMRDGRHEPWFWESGDRLKIGSEDTTLDGSYYDYAITWRTVDVHEPGRPGETLWWWDVIGDRWRMPIGSATIKARLPATPKGAQCVIGAQGKCTVRLDGRTLRIRAGRLDPYTPVTLRARFSAGDLSEPRPPEPWLEHHTGSMIAALIAGLLGLGFVGAVRERRPSFPVVFEPPPGSTPALAAYVLNERHSSADLESEIYRLGEAGVIEIVPGEGEAWLIRRLERGPSAADKRLLKELGLGSRTARLELDESDATRQRLTDARLHLRSRVEREAKAFLEQSDAGYWLRAAGQLVLGAALLLMLLSFIWWGYLSPVVWAPIATFLFVIAGSLFDPATRTRRSAAARELWSRTGGFARFLTTDSSESRFDAAEHLDWYPRYLPWAVALGVGDAWARRFLDQGVLLPPIRWLAVADGDDPNPLARFSAAFSLPLFIAAGGAFEAGLGGFGDSPVADALDGLSGGFFGGSGGGGGGGGSW